MPAFSVVADLGGTNVRFATTTPTHALGAAVGYRVADVVSFEAALDRFLADACGGERPEGLAIGAAGPVSGGAVKLTNAAWRVTRDELARRLPGGRVVLVNDLQAVARALPELTPEDLVPLRPGSPDLSGPEPAAIAINVGTGFGAAPLHRFTFSGHQVWITTATEAGHMSDPFDAGVGRSSLEDVLSGRGIAAGATAAEASAVFAAAAAGDAAAERVAHRFGRLLGRAVRDLVLAHGAWSGAYLVGSVVRGWHDAGATAFWDGFDAPGPMAERLADVPVVLVNHPCPALLGLSHMLAD